MLPYSSIETVYTRDKETNVLNFGEIRCIENTCINTWTISEKIDGTNIRIIVTKGGIEIRGRTDKAQLNQDLVKVILAIFPSHERLLEYFTEYRGQELPDEWSVTFYGEGYGAGIQAGGSYSDTKRFRCFDLLLGESWWTDDDEMRRVCDELSIPTVPCLAVSPNLPKTREELAEIIPFSHVAYEDRGVSYILAEGIVAKPLHVLLNRHKDRVMWKITFREWEKDTRTAAKGAA